MDEYQSLSHSDKDWVASHTLVGTHGRQDTQSEA